MFDIDGNGTIDPGEEYLAFRIWEEMNGIDEEETEPEEAAACRDPRQNAAEIVF